MRKIKNSFINNILFLIFFRVELLISWKRITLKNFKNQFETLIIKKRKTRRFRFPQTTKKTPENYFHIKKNESIYFFMISKKTDGYSSITKNIWADTMEESQRKLENSWYEKPNNIIAVPLNPITGGYDAKKRSLFFFVKGTEPIYENQKK